MSKGARLWIVLALNLALVGVLVVVGRSAHSIGVWAQGADYLADAAAVGLSLLAIHLSQRPPTVKRPQGYPRATSFAALVNAGWLLILSLLVAAGAANRLVSGVHQVHGLAVLIVSGSAGALMLASAVLLGGDLDEDEPGEGQEDLNVRAVLLDTAADAAAAAGVALTGAIIYAAHGLYWLDPTAALIIAAVIGYHATRLLLRIRQALAG